MAPATELHLMGEEATRAFAQQLAAALNAVRTPGAAGMVIFLSGPLGAGKTTLVRGLLRSLGHAGRVRSPSFTIMEPYALPGVQVHHFDFYRFTVSDEWREAGFEELIGAPGTLSLIEWPEMAGQSLAAPDLSLRLGIPEPAVSAPSSVSASAATDAASDDDESFDAPRTLYLQAFSAPGQRVLSQLGTW